MVLQLVFHIYKTTNVKKNQLIKSCQHKRVFFIMKSILFLAPLLVCVLGGHIQHSDKATSYQNFEIQHHHAVPTYIKKEDAHLLAHPISKGKSSANVQIHHGGKYDHGYALTNVQNTDGHELAGLGDEHGHVQYEVQEQTQQQYQYEPEEVQSDQQGYQTIDAAEYAKLAAAAADEFNHKYAGRQGVGHYEAYQQQRS